MPFALELSRVLRRARELDTGDGVALSLPGVSFVGSIGPSDRAVLELALIALARENIAQWTDPVVQGGAGALECRRSVVRAESITRLARMSVRRETSPALVVLLDSITEAVREFRNFERDAGVRPPPFRPSSDWEYPDSCKSALGVLRAHVGRTQQQLRALVTGNLLETHGERPHWPSDEYTALGAEREQSTEEFLATIRFITRQNDIWLPYSEHANTSARERPSAEAAATMLRRLTDDWPAIAGEDIASITEPVALHGRKLRRLIVRADFGARPPWGDWQHLDPYPGNRPFTELRRRVNAALAPHEVDHIDFVPRDGPRSPEVVIGS